MEATTIDKIITNIFADFPPSIALLLIVLGGYSYYIIKNVANNVKVLTEKMDAIMDKLGIWEAIQNNNVTIFKGQSENLLKSYSESKTIDRAYLQELKNHIEMLDKDIIELKSAIKLCQKSL